MKKFKNIDIAATMVIMLAICPILMTACNEKKEKIDIYQNFKTDYVVGEALDISTGILKYTF